MQRAPQRRAQARRSRRPSGESRPSAGACSVEPHWSSQTAEEQTAALEFSGKPPGNRRVPSRTVLQHLVRKFLFREVSLGRVPCMIPPGDEDEILILPTSVALRVRRGCERLIQWWRARPSHNRNIPWHWASPVAGMYSIHGSGDIDALVCDHLHVHCRFFDNRAGWTKFGTEEKHPALSSADRQLRNRTPGRRCGKGSGFRSLRIEIPCCSPSGFTPEPISCSSRTSADVSRAFRNAVLT